MERYSLPPQLKNGCVLFLDGTTSGTTAYDASWNGNHWTLVNAPTRKRRHGYKGWSFNGSNQSITFPNVTWLRSFCASIYPTANNKTIILVSSGNSINLSSSNTITVTGLTNATVHVNWTTVNSVPLNQWSHISVTFDSINSSSGNIANSSFAWIMANAVLRTETNSIDLSRMANLAFFIP